ncbi:unnamed protein product [Thelazia callipaeda]|uniref:Cytochrome b n=1 Tax=Thelazia callipaeda TaxID=103827 RepID=A0A0N5CXC8_THECL|nr:unnamed protein product [Thelazia callipaeda]
MLGIMLVSQILTGYFKNFSLFCYGIWLSGVIIYLKKIGIAFTGYVLVSGQMRYCAADVITSLIISISYLVTLDYFVMMIMIRLLFSEILIKGLFGSFIIFSFIFSCFFYSFRLRDPIIFVECDVLARPAHVVPDVLIIYFFSSSLFLFRLPVFNFISAMFLEIFSFVFISQMMMLSIRRSNGLAWKRSSLHG